jgi:hypothetical protein
VLDWHPYAFVLQIKGIRSWQKIKMGPAIFTGSVAVIVYQGLFFVFNR